ncbi:hypothetical protein MUJ63_11870 [Lachnospiraceae bacterium NSJ-143]|nr:hypothetical protein [Lachnospiraceae bacterium NSJ-143]
MKYLKRIGATVLAAALAMSFSACGNSSTGNGSASGSAQQNKEMTVEERVEAARTTMADVKNMEAKMIMLMSMESQGQTLDMNSTMNITSFVEPLKMKIDMNMDMGELGSQDMSMYAEETEDGKYIMYVYDGTQWISQEVPVDTFEQYDTRDSMDMYLDGVTELKDAGTEKVDDKDAVRIDGIITGDALEETIKSSGALDNMKQTLGGQIDDATLDSMFKDLGNISVSIWLDSETNYPVKYSMDMTDVMGKLYNNIFSAIPGGEEAQINVSKMLINMEGLKYNADITDFEIPAEAKQ